MLKVKGQKKIYEIDFKTKCVTGGNSSGCYKTIVNLNYGVPKYIKEKKKEIIKKRNNQSNNNS